MQDCSMSNATDVLVVVPSTMWFTRNAQPSDVVRWVVCLNDLPIQGTRQTQKGDINTKLATTNLSHINIGLTSMIMNCTNQETVIQ